MKTTSFIIPSTLIKYIAFRYAASIAITMLCLDSSSTAIADSVQNRPAQISQLVGGYVGRNHFPQARQIHITDRSGHQRTRLCVPVTQNSVTDFMTTFGEQNGCVIVRRTSSRNPYIRMCFSPRRVYMSTADRSLCGPKATDPSSVKKVMLPIKGSFYTVLNLGRNRITHMGQVFDTFHNTTDRYLNKLRYQQARGLSSVFADCMWWFVHAEPSPNENIATLVGVRRSRAPQNLAAKMNHQGNSFVPVIGVGVENVQQFSALQDQDLLGPAPLREVY